MVINALNCLGYSNNLIPSYTIVIIFFTGIVLDGKKSS